MATKRFSSLGDIQELISLQVGEDARLEFKRSDIVTRRQTNELAKEICAFANSDGGSIIIGLAESDKTGIAERLDDGISPSVRAKDWIQQIVQSHIRPSLFGVIVHEIPHGDNHIVVVDVSKSNNGPHQSQDKRYYRRHAGQSYPMDDYEIEDLRARASFVDDAIDLKVVMHGMLYYISISNSSAIQFEDFYANVTSNFGQLFDDRRFPVSPIMLRHVRPGQVAEYMLGSAYEIFSAVSEPHLRVEYSYKSSGLERAGEEEFFFSDYATQSVVATETNKILSSIADSLSKIERHQRQFDTTLRDISRAVTSAGLKLSPTTLRALVTGEMPKHDPFTMDGQGFSDVLDVDIHMGYQLQGIFGVIGSEHTFRREILSLPTDIQKSLAERFHLTPSNK